MFKKRTRPLFSVIISCYNSGDYIDTMLTSLVKQKMSKSELEVIISDDCSTISYDDILDKYNKKLNIKKIVADHNWGFPGHTREQGVSIATGEWITFADHDDKYIENSFKKLEKFIKAHNPDSAVMTGLHLKKNDTDNIYTKFENSTLTHGVFFNFDNYWKKFDIHYRMDDYIYHEDVYIMSLLYNHIIYDKIIPYDVSDEIATYIWNICNERSFGSSDKPKYNGRYYFDISFPSYIMNTYYIDIDYYIKNNRIIEYSFDLEEQVIYSLVTIWYYYQGIIYTNTQSNIPIDKENDIVCKNLVDNIMEELHYADISIITDYIEPKRYNDAIDVIKACMGYVIPNESFKDWINRIYRLEV